jgi:2-polyprenyl-3-methyl-5-hydroxy-6-metoxy-1,4-benzoquinol methylase
VSGCWICGDTVSACARFAPEPFFECDSCGFIFRPELGAATLRQVYAGGGYEDLRGEHYLRELADRRRDACVRLRYIAPWVARGRLLDVGAAGGAFVAEAAAHGFDAAGIEPVPSFARAAREQLGVDVRDGGIEDAALGEGNYDAITLWHVLEHLPNPLQQLSRLAGALDTGGTLAVEVPNAGSAVAVHMGSTWTSLEPTVHVNQFTPESLREALERAGLELRDLRTTTITPYLRARSRLGPRHLAGRAKAALWLRDARREHASGHELLRAVAQRS